MLMDDAKATGPENFAFMQKINSHPVHLFSLLYIMLAFFWSSLVRQQH